jgi:hypothetical protein
MMTANELLTLAADYSEVALEHLSLTNWRREDKLDGAIELFRTKFLFPEVDDIACNLLTAARHTRRADGFLRATELNSPGALPEGALKTAASQHEAIVECIRSCEFVHALTPVQAEILESEFLSPVPIHKRPPHP